MIKAVFAAMLALIVAGCGDAPRQAPAEERRSTSADAGDRARTLAKLEQQLAALASSFDGSVSIAVQDVHSGERVGFRHEEAAPQQSVSKLWVALATLAAVDRGEFALSDIITVRRSDLTLFYQPIRRKVGANGYDVSIAELLELALVSSDNTANDVLLNKLGGPASVRAALAERNLTGIRFGPGERELQTRIAGLRWKPSYSIGQTFWIERAKLPAAIREEALDNYLRDPPDAATAAAIVAALSRLKRGELLSPAASAVFLDMMGRAKSGPNRLRGGLMPGWTMAHKTGTGQVLGRRATGFNDVGLLEGPRGESYAVAVLIASTTAPIPKRLALMSQVTRAIIKVDEPGAPDFQPAQPNPQPRLPK